MATSATGVSCRNFVTTWKTTLHFTPERLRAAVAVKKLAIFLLKVFGSGALIGYLVWDAIRNDAFRLLLEQPKDWGLLILGAGFFVASAVACFLRWGFLVRALSIPFSHSEALRLGMIGYLVNLAPMGVVGGDLVKMVLLARLGRSEPEHAVASVLVDRAIGLYMLFVVAGAALLWTGFGDRSRGIFSCCAGRCGQCH